MRLTILLACCAIALGQDTSPAPEAKSQNSASPIPEQKQQPSGNASPNNGFSKYGANMSPGAAIQQATKAVAHHPGGSGALDILSDTQGVDFGPYLQDMIETVRKNWYHLIPPSAETKKGKLAIEFAIRPDGQLADMKLVASSGDVVLDRPAWGSITGSNPFKPLPDEFKGPYLALRFRFYYNPDKSDFDRPDNRTLPEPAHSNETVSISSAPSKSGITVSISAHGGLQVPVGASKVIAATVTGTKKQAVKWRISGLACSNSACGEMVGNLYLAPRVPPIPPDVTVTAVSKADPTANASITLHVVASQ
jgi:TonB C terminal